MKNTNDRGSIYITVIIIIAILLMLLSMLVIIAGRDMRTSNLYSDGIRAYFIAQTGISRGLKVVKTDPKSNSGESEENTFPEYPKHHTLEWSVVYNDAHKYEITSKAFYYLNDQITVKRELEFIVYYREDNGEFVIESWKQI